MLSNLPVLFTAIVVAFEAFVLFPGGAVAVSFPAAEVAVALAVPFPPVMVAETVTVAVAFAVPFVAVAVVFTVFVVVFVSTYTT